MKYLIDTHIFLWARLEPSRLSITYQNILQDPLTEILVSPLSLWEMSLKFALGKLELGGHTPDAFWHSAVENHYQLLDIAAETYASFYKLPRVVAHQDPFDRMLIWQAISSNVNFLSYDRRVQAYEAYGLSLA